MIFSGNVCYFFNKHLSASSDDTGFVYLIKDGKSQDKCHKKLGLCSRETNKKLEKVSSLFCIPIFNQRIIYGCNSFVR
jgi:hypothetical protein